MYSLVFACVALCGSAHAQSSLPSSALFSTELCSASRYQTLKVKF